MQVQQLEALATAGAFGQCFGLKRRAALWAVGAVAAAVPIACRASSSALPPGYRGWMSSKKRWPICGRPALRRMATRRSSSATGSTRSVSSPPPGVAGRTGHTSARRGIVTHRQRPMTAQGTTFLNLEDETGLMNIVVSKGCWTRHRRVAREAPALLIRGRLERSEGVINIVAEAMEPLPVPASVASRDFH